MERVTDFSAKKNRNGAFVRSDVVEATRVELVSENSSARTSPGAACGQIPKQKSPQGKLLYFVASFFHGRTQSFAHLTFTAVRRPFKSRGTLLKDGCT